MQAKASNSSIQVCYDLGSTPSYHCPGQTMTPCSVISIVAP